MRTRSWAPRGILTKEEIHIIKECSKSGWGQWSFLFKCAVKDAPMYSHRIQTSVETVSQKVSLEHVCATTDMDVEEPGGVASKCHDFLAHVIQGEAFMVLRGVGVASGIET